MTMKTQSDTQTASDQPLRDAACSRICNDPARMAEMAKDTEGDDIFGTRQFPVCYFPTSATVGQVMAALYWPKSWEIESADEEEDGGMLAKTRCKPEYVRHLIEETLKAGGGFYSANISVQSRDSVD